MRALGFTRSSRLIRRQELGMGYDSTFYGEFEITPPLNWIEAAYLGRFAATRRMSRAKGPYFVGGGGDLGQHHEADVIDYNHPPHGQPSLWCQWEPSEDGCALRWDGGEKFYCSVEWLTYLIEHFLRKSGYAGLSTVEEWKANGFDDFTFDHVVNGAVEVRGEDQDDLWRIVVVDNKVTTQRATIGWA